MADTTNDTPKPYTQFPAFAALYRELLEHQNLPQPKAGHSTARALWTFIMQITYFSLFRHGWCLYATRPGSTPCDDPPVVVCQRLSGLRDCLELCGVLVAEDDDDLDEGWERQEERVVGFVKGIAHEQGHEPNEGGVFAVVAKGARARFYWLDGEGVLKPYQGVGERAFEARGDEGGVMGVLKGIAERVADLQC